MKDFFDTWKFKILVGIAVFLVGIMAYAGANGRLTAAPQGAAERGGCSIPESGCCGQRRCGLPVGKVHQHR